MENKRHSGGNLNIFIFGVLVGVAATLLLTTKKGRKLLKVITDEGADRLSQVEKMVKEMESEAEEEAFFEEDDITDEEVNDYSEVERKPARKVEKIEVKSHAPVARSHEDEVESVKPKKRLFRGIRKRTS